MSEGVREHTASEAPQRGAVLHPCLTCATPLTMRHALVSASEKDGDSGGGSELQIADSDAMTSTILLRQASK